MQRALPTALNIRSDETIVRGFHTMTGFALLGTMLSACGDAPSATNTPPAVADSELLSEYDREGLDLVLHRFVDESGLVDYKGLLAERALLDAHLERVGRLAPAVYDGWDEHARIAFWLNTYNAYTLRAVLDHYPIQASRLKSLVYPANSIRQIAGVWDTLEWGVMGRTMTLNHMEHEILRKEFTGEPRIHAALVCAARGCPPLRNEAYTGERLDAQLDDQMRRFLGDPKKYRLDREGGTVYLSKIFEWYGQDFLSPASPSAGSKEGLLGAIAEYLPPEDRAFIESAAATIDYLDYDWTLNER